MKEVAKKIEQLQLKLNTTSKPVSGGGRRVRKKRSPKPVYQQLLLDLPQRHIT